MKTCKVSYCNNKHHAKGYCSRHYRQYKKHKEITSPRFDKNQIIYYDTHAEIILYDIKNKEIARTLIDLDDINKCSKYRWSISNGYAITKIKLKTIPLHRIIIGKKYDLQVDHIDHNILDNRKTNLRLVTRSQNQMNSIKRKNCSSKYKGVSWSKRNKKWQCHITKNKKLKYLGIYINEEDAAIAYNIAAKEYFGEYALLNILE